MHSSKVMAAAAAYWVRHRTCKKCGDEFILSPGKPGLATTCPSCSVETTPRVAGVTVWEGKHTPVLYVTTQKKAREIALGTRRLGAGVTAALCPRGAETDNPGTKKGTGAERHATYISGLREKHHGKD